MTMQPSVLVVEEEDKFIRESIAHRLCRAGYSVSQLCHPRQALAATTARCYDVAILANELPELDGVSLMQRLRRRGGIHQFVIITRNDSDLQGKGATDHGAFAVLTWSSLQNELESTVERAVEESCAESSLVPETLDDPTVDARTKA
jgi:DNA-binding NtrC family response regulator